MSDPILYHALHSTCSQKVRYALAYKQLAYRSRIVDLATYEHLSDAYLAINPNGVVPAMTHDGANIVDSSVICEYIDEVFPGAALSPATPPQRAAMRAWMRYFEEVPTVAIRVPSINKLFLQHFDPDDAATGALKNRMPVRRHFYAKLGRNGFAPELIQESTEQLAACLARVEKAVSAGGPHLLGVQLTIADIVLLPTLVRMEDLGMAEMWRGHPCVARWYAAMQAQPAFGQTFVPGSRFKVA